MTNVLDGSVNVRGVQAALAVVISPVWEPAKTGDGLQKDWSKLLIFHVNSPVSPDLPLDWAHVVHDFMLVPDELLELLFATKI